MVIDLPRTAAQSLAGRLVNLYLGLVLFGISMAMLVEARLGLIPDPDFDSIIRMHLAESRPGGNGSR